MSQKWFHVAFVTKFPVQLCAISCATTPANEPAVFFFF